MSAHDFTFEAIDGSAMPLERFRGKALLIVNTASACGYTPQYAELQALWGELRDRGLVVIGVPSNDFGQQEPGSGPEIQAFCSRNYGVDFPLTAKQRVVGSDPHPFFSWIEGQFGEAMRPRWNFHKYLVDADGNLVGGWPAKVRPQSPEIRDAIEAVLPV